MLSDCVSVYASTSYKFVRKLLPDKGFLFVCASTTYAIIMTSPACFVVVLGQRLRRSLDMGPIFPVLYVADHRFADTIVSRYCALGAIVRSDSVNICFS